MLTDAYGRRRRSGATRRGSILAGAAVLAMGLGLAGCANPLKPSIADASGGPVRKAVVLAEYVNAAAVLGLSHGDLSEALGLALDSVSREETAGAVQLVRAEGRPSAAEVRTRHPDATHLIDVHAQLVSKSESTPGTWNACQYTDKRGKCVGGMDGGSFTRAQARVSAEIVELAGGRVVFRIDHLTSGTVPGTEDSPMKAATPIARQLARAFKQAKLYP